MLDSATDIYYEDASINCINFKPTLQQQCEIKWVTDKLINFAPHNSYVTVMVQQIKQSFHLHIRIAYGYGEFVAHSVHTDFQKALVNCERSLTKQIKKWRKSRFTTAIA